MILVRKFDFRRVLQNLWRKSQIGCNHRRAISFRPSFWEVHADSKQRRLPMRKLPSDVMGSLGKIFILRCIVGRWSQLWKAIS